MRICNEKSVPTIDAYAGVKIHELIGARNNSSQQQSIAVIDLAPQSKSFKHYHPVVEESYYILNGEAVVLIDDEEHIMQAGDCVCILPGHWHEVSNRSQSPVKMLAICTPPWTPDCSVYAEANKGLAEKSG